MICLKKTIVCVIILASCSRHTKVLKATEGLCVPETKSEIVAIKVPEVRAEFPGGNQQLIKYIRDNVINKITVSQSEAAVFKVSLVQWTIDESGLITDVQVLKSSGIPRIDTLFTDAVKQMPTWKPAKNAGKTVRDEFQIPLRICFK